MSVEGLLSRKLSLTKEKSLVHAVCYQIRMSVQVGLRFLPLVKIGIYVFVILGT